MTRRRRKAIGLLLCLCALAIVLGGWSRVRASADRSTDNAYVRGEVTSLSPKVGGYVTAVEVEDNQAVVAGDVLFRIDDRDYVARLAQASANVDAAQARVGNVDAEISLQRALVRQAEAQRRATAADLDLARKADDRFRELVSTQLVSRAQADETAAARSRATAAVSAASASVEAQEERIAVLVVQRAVAAAAVAQAEAALELARIDLENTVVRAPVDGVVGNRQVRVGRLVAPGAALLDIVPVGDLWIVANFKETQLAHVQAGRRVHITVDGYPDRTFSGVIDSFAPGSGSAFSLLPADNATGNFVRVVQRVPVKIRFAGDRVPVPLVPGLSARVEIDADRGS